MTFFKQLLVQQWKHVLLQKHRSTFTILELAFPLILFLVLISLRSAYYRPFQLDASGNDGRKKNISIKGKTFVNLRNSSSLVEDISCSLLDFYADYLKEGKNYTGCIYSVDYYPQTALKVMNRTRELLAGDVVAQRMNKLPENGTQEEFFEIVLDRVCIEGQSLFNSKDLSFEYNHGAVLFTNYESRTTATELPVCLRYHVYKRQINGVQQIKFPSFADIDRKPYTDIKDWYRRENTLLLQWMVAKSYIDQISEVFPEDLEIRMEKMPVPGGDYRFKKPMLIILLCIPLITFVPVTFQTLSIVEEREKGLLEFTKMIGLSSAVYWTSWFIHSFMKLTAITFIFMAAFFIKFNENGPIFEFTSPTLYFAFSSAYFAMIVSFTFCVSVFFKRPAVAASISSIIIFITVVVDYIVIVKYSGFVQSTKWLVCLLYSTTYSIGNRLIYNYEYQGDGATWGNLYTPPLGEDFTLGYCMLMMLVHTFIFLLITWYISNVWPGEFGVPQPTYFCFTKTYWCGSSDKMHNLDNQMSPELEKNFARKLSLPVGIEISKLQKDFGHVRAVNISELEMYEGEIFVLLGHNGAGKTTTMSMLTGLFPPTSGTAYINGLDIRYDLKEIRKQLGLCPQFSIIFDTLTVEEHLLYFAKLQGNTSRELKRDVRDMLNTVGLEGKERAQSKTLSGGQKRKLSIAIAFVNRPKVVILDEPSSGMDPEAKQQMWDMLRGLKEDRTILMSTHYMDEADALGDRIAIMVDSIVVCCGPPMFLKKVYGAGSHLIIDMSPECDVRKVTEFIKLHMPSAYLESKGKLELSYALPKDESSLIPGLLRRIEENNAELGIRDYGASATTMNEVFHNVGERVAGGMYVTPQSSKFDEMADSQVDPIFQEHSKDAHKLKNTGSSVGDIDKRTEAVSKVSEEVLTKKDVSGNDSQSASEAGERVHPGCLELIWYRIYGLLLKRLIVSVRSPAFLMTQFSLPPLLLLFIHIIASPARESPSTNQTTDTAYLDLSLDSYNEGSTIVYSVTPSDDKELAEIASAYKNQFSDKHQAVEKTDVDEFLWNVKDSLGELKFGYHYLIGAKFYKDVNDSITIVGLYNSYPLHSQPITLSYITKALVKHYGAGTYEIKAGLYSDSDEDNNEDPAAFLLNQIVLIPTLFIAFNVVNANFLVFIIKERISGSKILQIMSGVSPFMYWSINFIVDFLIFLVPCLLTTLIIAEVIHPEGFDIWGKLMPLLTLYIWSSIPLTYCMEVFFRSPLKGMAGGLLINFMATISTLGIATWQMMLNKTEVLDIAFSFLYPHHGAVMAIMLGLSGSPNTTQKEFLTPTKRQVILFLQGVAYFVLRVYMDYHFFQRLRACCQKDSLVHPKHKHDTDDDVASERKRINASTPSQPGQEDVLRLVNLSKQFNGLVAVDNICLGIQKNECFGLLGQNGAGKTTIFKMIIGFETISSGDVHCNGSSIRKKISKVQSNMGYCPQEDALIEEMTGEETLYMFARLRGIPGNEIKPCVDSLVQRLDFQQHVGKLTKKMSGGNKRKLSTAVALIGDPPVILLDEPSSGMDPGARLHLWSVLSEVRASGKTLILTSHNMEECEALCTRITIMMKGRMVCLGSLQHLKSKFAQGYTLMVKMGKDVNGGISPVTAVVDHIHNKFPSCYVFSSNEGYAHLQVPDPEVHLADLFEVLEDCKQDLNLEDYSVQQTSLKQVFLKLTHDLSNEKQKTDHSCFNRFCCCFTCLCE